MKLTKARLKEIILEEINEMYVTDFAGSAEDRAIDRHRARKRAPLAHLVAMRIHAPKKKKMLPDLKPLYKQQRIF